jgi:branched-chain amino acid transport system ATP-binding protein
VHTINYEYGYGGLTFAGSVGDLTTPLGQLAVILDEVSELFHRRPCAGMALKQQGVTILLAEQNLHLAARVADRTAVIEKGQIVWTGTIAARQADKAARTYLAL